MRVVKLAEVMLQNTLNIMPHKYDNCKNFQKEWLIVYLSDTYCTYPFSSEDTDTSTGIV